MIGIRVELPSGRYHATPWGHHVNEGEVEWPPSPYRMLRALLATWHLKAKAEVDEAVMRAILDQLADDTPEYCLPSRAVLAHTRHYMPLFGRNTTKVFDTFVHVEGHGAIDIVYRRSQMDPARREALALVVERLGYLGRAESWAVAHLFEPDESWQPNVVPAPRGGEAEMGARGYERLPLLAPVAPAELEKWRVAIIDEHLTRALEVKRAKAKAKGKPVEKVKLSAKDRSRVESELPRDLVEVLEADTSRLRKAGWNRPPGTRWLDYRRPRALLQARPRVADRPRTELPTVARFAVAGSVVPRFTQALLWAETMRVALMSRSGGDITFAGKSGPHQPLIGHPHAFILPEANGRSGQITHFTIFAPNGFDGEARRALDRISRLYTQKPGRRPERKQQGTESEDEEVREHGQARQQVQELQLVLLGVGGPRDFAGKNFTAGQCPLFGPSAAWESRTPFVATRHLKRRRNGTLRVDEYGEPIGGPENDLRRLLVGVGCPAPIAIERRDGTDLNGRPTRWHEFRTRRSRGEGRRGGHPPAGFRVTFAERVTGPIAVGYGAHFGLGLFLPGEGE